MDLGTKQNNEKFNFFIIEDMPYMIDAIQYMIRMFGGKVIGSAETANKGLSSIAEVKDQVDIITLDINMPYTQGIDIVPKLKEICPKAKIVILSGENAQEIQDKIISSGVSAFISKPFDKEKVFPIIKKLCEEVDL